MIYVPQNTLVKSKIEDYLGGNICYLMSSLKYLVVSLKKRKEIPNMISAKKNNSPVLSYFAIGHAAFFCMNHNESSQTAI